MKLIKPLLLVLLLSVQPVFAESKSCVFFPTSPTTSLSVTSTSSAIGLTASPGEIILVTNAGPNVAFVRFAATSPTAIATDLPVLPYTAVLVGKGASKFAAGISAATQTATVYLTVGACGS